MKKMCTVDRFKCRLIETNEYVLFFIGKNNNNNGAMENCSVF